MSRPADKKLRLRYILEVEAKLDTMVTEFLMTSQAGPQLESPADLAMMWTEGTARERAVTDAVDHLEPALPKTSFPGRRLIGRLLAAWDYAREDHMGRRSNWRSQKKSQQKTQRAFGQSTGRPPVTPKSSDSTDELPG